jgi:hypothetical protein
MMFFHTDIYDLIDDINMHSVHVCSDEFTI